MKEERRIALERAKEEQENRAEVMRKRDEARKVKGSSMHCIGPKGGQKL